MSKDSYLSHVKVLYQQGYKFVIKVTDENNNTYLFADNPSGLWPTKECVDFWDENDGINHFKYEDAIKAVKVEQKYHPNWIYQIKEISFEKQ